MYRLLLLVLVVASGCVPKAVSQRIEALENRVAQLETQPNAANRPDAADEAAARDLVSEIQRAYGSDYDVAAAAALCREGKAKYANTNAWRRGSRTCDEVGVVGKPAADWDVEQWFQGQAPAAGEPMLLVFFEQWCPHCRREMPRLGELEAQISVVGVTKVNRSSTDDKVVQFIGEHDLTFPIAKERNGSLSQHYVVSGVPAAAIVVDGVVVWRGHPARLHDGGLKRAMSMKTGSKNRGSLVAP
ncbi:MAG: TlpA family protein disulfide reductase [Myxococcota bacterium]